MEEISNLINCLTNDEDQRQELWTYYLSGNDTSSLAPHLHQINIQASTEEEFRQSLWKIFKNPPSQKFQDTLSRFSSIEQSVMVLLVLGLTVSEVAAYKGIDEVRIRQVIQVIRYNEVWNELYGIIL